MTEQTIHPTHTSEQPSSEQTPPIVIEVPAAESNPVLDRFWTAVKRIPRYVFLGTHLVRDDRVPKKVKGMVALGGAYLVSPVDLVPGLIPVAGQLDDLVVLLIALRRAVRACPPEIAEEHLTRAGVTMEDFDTDLKAVKDTAVWLAQKGLSATGRAAASGGRRLRQWWENR